MWLIKVIGPTRFFIDRILSGLSEPTKIYAFLAISNGLFPFFSGLLLRRGIKSPKLVITELFNRKNPQNYGFLKILMRLFRKLRDNFFLKMPQRSEFFLVEVTGVEPVTFCMPCKRSSQLS